MNLFEKIPVQLNRRGLLVTKFSEKYFSYQRTSHIQSK